MTPTNNRSPGDSAPRALTNGKARAVVLVRTADFLRKCRRVEAVAFMWPSKTIPRNCGRKESGGVLPPFCFDRSSLSDWHWEHWTKYEKNSPHLFRYLSGFDYECSRTRSPLF